MAGFWDDLLKEMGVESDGIALPVNYMPPPPPAPSVYGGAVKTYHVGDVIVGEIVEDEELTTGAESVSLEA